MSADTIVGSLVGVLLLWALIWYALFDPIDPPPSQHHDERPSGPPVLGQYVHVHRLERDEIPASRGRAWSEYPHDPLTGEVIEPAPNDPLIASLNQRQLGDGR